MGFSPVLRCVMLLVSGGLCTSVGGHDLRQRALFPRQPVVQESWVPASDLPLGFRLATSVEESEGPARAFLLFALGIILLWLGYRAWEDARDSRAQPYEGSWSDQQRKAREESETPASEE